MLEYIPEAHCYLRIGKSIVDATKPNSQPSDFVNDLLSEIEINPNQISSYKIDYLKKYLSDWLADNNNTISLNALWNIREKCIQDLAAG